MYVCVAPGKETLYFAREKKGHEGVKGTAAEEAGSVIPKLREHRAFVECMSVLVMMRQEERANLFAQVSQIFG